MGTASCGGRGFKERIRVSSEGPIGATSFRQQSTPASWARARLPDTPHVNCACISRSGPRLHPVAVTHCTSETTSSQMPGNAAHP